MEWSKNFDVRPQGERFFIGKIWCDTWLLLWPANQNAGQQYVGNFRRQGHWEQCSVACGKILTSSSLKSDPSCWESGPHLLHSSLGEPKSTSRMASRSVQPFCSRWCCSVMDSDLPRWTVITNIIHITCIYSSTHIVTVTSPQTASIASMAVFQVNLP